MRALFPVLTFMLLAGTSCKHDVETYTSDALTDYLPLTQGKYITYQLDSTVFIGFTLNPELRRYQEKNVVGAPFTDNLGRQSFPIYRSLRDSAGTQPWTAAGTYFITPTDKTIEVVENNLRTVRLSLPVKTEFSWKGNGYLPDDAYEPAYNFDNDNSIKLWDYRYDALQTENIGGAAIADVLSVQHINDSQNVATLFKAEVDTVKAWRDFSVDKYAKGIGLVYQELIMWDLEPQSNINYSTSPPTITYAPYYRGFGVRRTLLEHN
jgi:hypothetical protein